MITRSKAPTKERRVAEYEVMSTIYAQEAHKAEKYGFKHEGRVCRLKSLEYHVAAVVEQERESC